MFINFKLMLLQIPLFFGFMKDNYWKLENKYYHEKIAKAARTNNQTLSQKLSNEYFEKLLKRPQESRQIRIRKKDSTKQTCYITSITWKEAKREIEQDTHYKDWRAGIKTETQINTNQNSGKEKDGNNQKSSFIPGQITYVEKEYGTKGHQLIIQTNSNTTTTYNTKKNWYLHYDLSSPNVRLEYWQWKADKHKFATPCTGVTETDIRQYLIPSRATHLVITTGVDDQLHIPQETKDFLENLKNQQQITDYCILSTCDAKEKYNQWIKEGHSVAGLFHLTC